MKINNLSACTKELHIYLNAFIQTMCAVFSVFDTKPTFLVFGEGNLRLNLLECLCPCKPHTLPCNNPMFNSRL